jgi:AcrR family transcriptional regulator
VSEDKLSRHERRSAETKKRILQAARAVFAKRGYGQASTREIAEAADVAEAGIFYHFGNKRGLLLALTDSLVDEMLSPVPLMTPENWLTWVAEVLRRRIAFVQENSALMSMLIHEVGLDEELRRVYVERVMPLSVNRLRARLDELIAAGRMRPINTAVAARAILGSYLSLMMPYPDPQLANLPAEEIVASLLDLYLHGLHVQPAPEEGEQ